MKIVCAIMGDPEHHETRTATYCPPPSWALKITSILVMYLPQRPRIKALRQPVLWPLRGSGEHDKVKRLGQSGRDVELDGENSQPSKFGLGLFPSNDPADSFLSRLLRDDLCLVAGLYQLIRHVKKLRRAFVITVAVSPSHVAMGDERLRCNVTT